MGRANAPEMLDGMRAPRSVRLESMRANAAATPLPAVAEGEGAVYVSNVRRYRVQVTAPPPAGTNALGIKMPGGSPYAAVFEEGVYRNNHRDPEMRALIDKVLQSNPRFGPFGSGADFWLASEQSAKVEAAKVESALATLKTLPRETVEQFVSDLRQGNAEDHELPVMTNAIAGESEQRGVRPIPSR